MDGLGLLKSHRRGLGQTATVKVMHATMQVHAMVYFLSEIMLGSSCKAARRIDCVSLF